MSVTEGGAKAVMNAFARVGAVWSGADADLMTNVLRNEWGFDGFVLTDFSGNPMFTARGIALRTFDAAYGVLAGTDSWDSSDIQWTTELTTQYKGLPRGRPGHAPVHPPHPVRHRQLLRDERLHR